MTDLTRERRTLLASAGAGVLLVAILAVLIRAQATWVTSLDKGLDDGAHRITLDHPGLASMWRAAALIFDVPVVWPVAILAAGALWLFRHRRAALWLVGTLAAAELTSVLVKLVVREPRPVWVHPIVVLSGYSFPSGHATRMAAVAGITIVLAAVLVRRAWLRRLIDLLALAAALLTGADRVFLGVHTVVDVVAGLLTGVTVVLVATALVAPLPPSLSRKRSPLVGLPEPAERRLGVVVNPSKVTDLPEFRSGVEQMARAAGWSSVRWWATTEEDTGFSMAHEAAVDGSTLVLAAGGDGTLRAVCQELAGTGIPVGIVPAGTGNLLARNLGIPLNLREAVDVALHGQDRAIDLVVVSGDGIEESAYLVMAGMGFDAAIMARVNEGFKARVGWPAYVWSALRSLMFPAMRVDIEVDDQPARSVRARTVVVGNVGVLQAGMPLLPDAVIDDGRIDVVVLYPRRFFSWVPLAVRVLTRDRRTDAALNRMTGVTVRLRATGAVPRQIDGDPVSAGRELVAVCRPGRLLVRVPF